MEEGGFGRLGAVIGTFNEGLGDGDGVGGGWSVPSKAEKRSSIVGEGVWRSCCSWSKVD